MRNWLTDLIDSIPIEGGWGPVAARLVEIKSGREVDRFGRSFSFFIKELAKARGKTESTYWRLVKAGEIYVQTRNSSVPQGSELPELTDPAIMATPESIEIVEKIRRAAPAEIANEIAYKAMRGLISRSELRDVWEAYRPILKGKNARGRQYDSPWFNQHDPEMLQAQDRANRIAPVVLSDPDWLGLKQSPYSYRVMNIFAHGRFQSLLSAVAALAETAESPILLHGFYTSNSPFPLQNRSVAEGDVPDDFPLFAVNFVWFVCAETPKPSEIEPLPDHVGIIICGEPVQIKRPAKLLQPMIPARERLLSELLRESLRIKQLHAAAKVKAL